MAERPDQAAGNYGRLRSRSLKDVLQEILSLSELHLFVASEELWDRWETVADHKVKLYEIIECSGVFLMDREDRATAARILDLEGRMIALLKGKRKRAVESLQEAIRPNFLLPSAGKSAVSNFGRLLRITC